MAKDHKYIEKKKGKNGEWYYIYDRGWGRGYKAKPAGTYTNIQGSKAGMNKEFTNIGGDNGSKAGMPNLSREKAYGKSKSRGKLYDAGQAIASAVRRAGLASKRLAKRGAETVSRMINKGKGRAREILNRLGLRKRRGLGSSAGAPYDVSKGKWAGRKSLGKNSVGAPSDIKLERGKWAGRKNGAKSSAGMPSNKRG